MKQKLFRSVLILAMSALSLFADNFSGQGTLVSSNLSYYIAPASGGAPRVLSLATTCDSLGLSSATLGVAAFWSKGTNIGPWVISGVTNSTNIVVSGNTLVSNDIVVVRNAGGGYERCYVWSNNASQVYLSAAPTTALAASDLVWRVSQTGKIRCGGSNYLFTAPGGVFIGSANWPLMITVAGVNTNVVDAVSGDYVP